MGEVGDLKVEGGSGRQHEERRTLKMFYFRVEWLLLGLVQCMKLHGLIFIL